MSSSPSPWFQDAITALSISRNQRVWSIIVSLFSDMARNPGDQISGPLMGRIIEPIGIKPEAIRVALHRLRNDGWITSHKQGRTSYYALTERGLSESAAASPRIYARQTEPPENWHVIVLRSMNSARRAEAEKSFAETDTISLGNGVFLSKSKHLPDTPDAFLFEGHPTQIPEWLKTQVAAPWQNSYKALAEALETLAQNLDNQDLNAIQSATLRTLIVHNWRRILLNHPDLPAGFYPGDWQGITCRDRVMELLDRLERPDMAQLENA